MDILRATNIGIRVGEITIPVTRIVCSSFGTLTEENRETILSLLMGTTTVCGYMVNSVSHPDDAPAFMRSWPVGATTYGDDTGFKLIYNVSKASSSPHTDRCGGALYYKGALVGTAPVPGSAIAPGKIESDPLIIVTDEDYNIASISFMGSGRPPIKLSYDNNGGVAQASGNIAVRTFDNSYLGITLSTVTTKYQLTGNNIKNDVTNEIDPTNTDPYAPGGETEPGGGEGDFDDNTEPIEFSEDPTLSAVDTGFITLFNPSLSQLNALANYMWGSLFDLENWKKLFANPMDAILGLSIVPVSVPDGGTSNVKVGNIDTGVTMTKAAKQYVNVDCGTLNVKEFWGAYLDYSPYTKAEIFLPFIGTHPLDIDDVMKKTVHVKYKVDILSGACIAQIKCGNAVLYSFSGQCAATIPVTGRDWTNVVGSALSIVGNVAGAAITGGMTAPTAAVNVAQAVTNVIKPNIQKSGNVAGMAGIMGIQKPYLILTRPRQAVPKNQNKYTGYPSFITVKLSKCEGYTEIEAVHLEGVPGTSEELNEIDRLLRNGVIF